MDKYRKKTPRLILVSLFILSVFSVHAQQNKYSQAEIENMKLTYSFYVVQDICLRVLAVKFPDLEKYATNAANEWQREFSGSIAKIDTQLYQNLKKEWEKSKKEIIYKYEGTDYSTISKIDAKKFIDVVFQRALGRIQSPIIETLLVFKPEYADHPEYEISDGYTNIYTTKNPKKQNDINIQIVFPKSWNSATGSMKSNLYRKFTSENGFGNLELLLYIEKNKKNYTPQMISQLLSRTNLKKKIQDTTNIIAYHSNGYIDNNPSATISYYKELNNIDKTLALISEEYHTYFANYYIKLVFNYIDPANTSREPAIESYERYNKLVRKIVNNVVILSQWEKKRF